MYLRARERACERAYLESEGGWNDEFHVVGLETRREVLELRHRQRQPKVRYCVVQRGHG